jgi:MFS transporter, FHS family, Na+ dependent glucose transporter 1
LATTTSTPSTTTTPSADERSARLQKTAAYYIAFIGLGMTTAAIGPTLPNLAAHTGSALQQVSYLFSALSFGYLIGSFGGGHLYDRVVGHRMLSAALLLLGAMAALVPAMPRLWLLAAVMLLMGIGQGAVDVGCNAMLVWVHRDAVAPYMNGLHLLFGVGTFLAPLLIAQVLLITGDINWGYWVIALVCLASVAWSLRLPSPAPQSAADEGARGAPKPVLVALIALFFFLYVGAEVSAGGWIYTFALKSGIATVTSAAYLTSVFWGAFTVGRALGVPIATRVSPPVVLTVDLLASLAGLAVIWTGAGSFTAVAAGTLLLGLSMASIFPTIISLGGQHMTLTGRVTGLFFVGISLGGMVLPWLIGQLFEPAGPRVAIVTIAIAELLAAIVFGVTWLYIRRQERQSA